MSSLTSPSPYRPRSSPRCLVCQPRIGTSSSAGPGSWSRDDQELIRRIIAFIAGQYDTIYHRGSYLSGSPFFLHFIELLLTFHLQYFLQNLPMLTFVKAATPEICSMV